MTNPRITVIADGVQTELIAEQTHLNYDPATGGGTVAFQYRPQLFVSEVAKGPAGDWSVLQLNIAEIGPRCFGTGTDPVTGADLSQISVTGVAAIAKAAFDIAFTEAADAAAAAQAAATGGA